MEDRKKQSNGTSERLQFFIVIVAFLVVHLLIAVIINVIFGEHANKGEEIKGYSVYSIKNILTIITSFYAGILLLKWVVKKDILGIYGSNINTKEIKPLKHEKKPIGSLIIPTLFLLCVVITLDYISYLIPQIYDYQLSALTESNSHHYFYFSLRLSFITIMIFHLSVAIREELFFRKYLLTTGKFSLKKNTQFLMCALLFGMVHFSYYFSETQQNYSIIYPIIWFINAFAVGLLFAYYFQKYHTVIPLIIIHWINNIISATNIKFYIDGYSEEYRTLNLYLPFLVFGLILLFLKFSSIMKNLNQLINSLIGYLYECQEYETGESILNQGNNHSETKTVLASQKKSSKKSKVDRWKEQVDNPEKFQKSNKKEINKSETEVKQKPKLKFKYIYKYLLFDIGLGITLWIFIMIFFI